MRNLHLYFAKGITSISTLLFNVCLAHISGVGHFGVFGLFLILTLLFNMASDWGFSVYGPVEINQVQSSQDKSVYIKQAFSFKVLITAISIVLYLFVTAVFYAINFQLLVFGVIVLLSNLFNLDWVLRAFGYFGIVSIRQVVNAILNLLFVVSVYYFSLPVKFVFLFYGVSLLLSFAFSSIFLIKKQVLFYAGFSMSKMLADTKQVVSRTKGAFGGIMVFNLVYSLNIPLLAFFSDSINTGIYTSYYTLFISVSAILTIAQDIGLPKYKTVSQELFYANYNILLNIGAMCGAILLLAIPVYFRYIFPPEFKVDLVTVSLMGILAYLYCCRLFFVHYYIINGMYKFFFWLNFIGAFFFSTITAGLILLHKYNYNTAIVSLLVSEVLIIVIAAVKRKNYYGITVVGMMITALLIGYNFMFPNSYVSVFVYGCLFLAAAFLFYKKLIKWEA
jgi:O-antigen/teichoic acid export membrane protein